jgi:GT2 family glycosyltransferase
VTRFSVVIPTMNRIELLRQTLESLRSCDPPPDEVIVIDADPGGLAREVVLEFQDVLRPAVRYLHTTPSLTNQRNIGIAKATGDVVVFIDDDVELVPRLFGMLDEAYSGPNVVGATGQVVEPHAHRRVGMRSAVRRFLPGGGAEGSFTRYGYPRYIQDVERPRDVEYMMGCFMSARREAAARVGFDERLGGYALAEDEDFSYRLSRLGRIVYLPEARVVHKKLGYSSKDSREFARLVVRNRAYLFRKNFDRGLLARVQFGFLILMLLVHRLVNRDWRAARGVVDGALEVGRRRR